MNFRTTVEPAKSNFSISHEMNLMLLGSCFAENIGNRLISLKFNVDLNPFGVIYNPDSISQCIERLIDGRKFEKEEIFFYNESWHSFIHHSDYSSPDFETCLNHINKRFEYSSAFLKKTNCLIITFGTAWVFYHAQSGKVVSNCHKLPSSHFERRLLDISTIIEKYETLINSLKQINPALNIIFTVSPVRHLNDGAEGNQLSKSILIAAVHELCKKGLGFYFPAYEIMLDDLRDYRFYDVDMIHPSQFAIDYIFEKYSATCFKSDTLNLNNKIEEINKAYNHRPFNISSEAFQSFSRQMIDKIKILETDYPYFDFTEEKKHFNQTK